MTGIIVNESVKEPKRRKRQPASEHQIAVNRANALRSSGPATRDGKARSSRNAIKHGLSTSRFTVVRLEDIAELEELRANLVDCYCPVNSQELEVIDWMARAQLSMRRAAQLEASLFTAGINQALGDPWVHLKEIQKDNQLSTDQNRGFFLAEGVRQLVSESSSILSVMLRYQAHAERQYHRAVDEFERLKKLRAEMPNEPISEHQFPSEIQPGEAVTPQPPAPQTHSATASPDPQPRPCSAGDLGPRLIDTSSDAAPRFPSPVPRLPAAPLVPYS